MSKYNDEWLSAVNGALDKISDFAEGAFDILTGESRNTAKEPPKAEPQMRSQPQKPVYVDRHKVAKEIAEKKAASWQIVLKYAGSIALLPFSVAILSSGLASTLFVCAFLSTVSVIGFGASLGLCLSANKDRKLKRLIKNYLPIVGARPEASIAYLSHALDRKPKEVKKEVKFLLSEGVFPNVAYFDGKLDILVLDGYIEDRGEIEIPEAEEEPDNMPCDLHVWIKKLNVLNVAILDAEVSSNLDILCEYVRKIAEYVEAHPGSEKKLRTFINYYLPTTVKLMEAYRTIEHMGDVGSNVAETKERIEKSMDSLITAYKQQFEAVYFAEAIDISGDIDVLETMINK